MTVRGQRIAHTPRGNVDEGVERAGHPFGVSDFSSFGLLRGFLVRFLW